MITENFFYALLGIYIETISVIWLLEYMYVSLWVYILWHCSDFMMHLSNYCILIQINQYVFSMSCAF